MSLSRCDLDRGLSSRCIKNVWRRAGPGLAWPGRIGRPPDPLGEIIGNVGCNVIDATAMQRASETPQYNSGVPGTAPTTAVYGRDRRSSACMRVDTSAGVRCAGRAACSLENRMSPGSWYDRPQLRLSVRRYPRVVLFPGERCTNWTTCDLPRRWQ